MAIHVTHTEAPYEGAIEDLCQELDQRPGMLFRSGTEAPGRYSRWDIGLRAPAVELRSRGRSLRLLGHGEAGERLLSLFLPALQAEPTTA